MSQPPELPGSQRLKRAAASAGSSAYQGVFEAVGAILIACGAGYYFDRHFETGPVGLLVGAVVGFGAFVLRLVRLGKELHPDSERGRAAAGSSSGVSEGSDPGVDDEAGTGVAPGMSDALRDDVDPTFDRSDRSDRSEQ